MRFSPARIRQAPGWGALAALVVLAAACRDGAPEFGGAAAPAARDVGLVRTSELHAGPDIPASAAVENPYAGDSRAVEQGKRYYNWFNCTGCHGGSGGGGIGPVLADDHWIYGGAPAQIFESIVKGRPNGMPSFGGQIPEDRLWMIVAYVESLAERAGEGGQ